jgi:branched-chain amino acid transport system ATP-binding protein
MSLLRVEALAISFGGVQAVRDLSFAIEPGTIHSIIGPNGAGKTTLFNLITGILRPSAGHILFEERDVVGRAPFELARLGIARTFQNLQIFDNMTARENVMVGRHRHLKAGLLGALLRAQRMVRADAACRDRADEFLGLVGLGMHRHADADSLPYGALKRLEIARALASEPKLLLLDEPAAGCNAREVQEVDALIQKIAEQGVTVVLVEHDMRLVMNISDRILVLDHGQKLAEGTAEEVRRNREVIAAYLGTGAAGHAARD